MCKFLLTGCMQIISKNFFAKIEFVLLLNKYNLRLYTSQMIPKKFSVLHS